MLSVFLNLTVTHACEPYPVIQLCQRSSRYYLTRETTEDLFEDFLLGAQQSRSVCRMRAGLIGVGVGGSGSERGIHALVGEAAAAARILVNVDGQSKCGFIPVF